MEDMWWLVADDDVVFGPLDKMVRFDFLGQEIEAQVVEVEAAYDYLWTVEFEVDEFTVRVTGQHDYFTVVEDDT